ncbi:MAG: 3-isopropylmalate dehydratase small subunit [Candidatus Omnitrophota bacterium]
MIFRGNVHKFGDDINTDDIIAAKYLVSTDAQELGSHCMETIARDFVKKVKKGDIIVAGKNFGCGSSREHAPIAIKGSGIVCVVAESFARIFFRNAINIGLAIIEIKDTSEIKDGDILEIILDKGIIKDLSNNKSFNSGNFPEFMQEIINAGGLIKYVQNSSNTR